MSFTLWTGSGDPVIDAPATEAWTDPATGHNDIYGNPAPPPLVDCGFSLQGWRVGLTMLQVTEAVRAAAPALGSVEREQIARNLDLLTKDDVANLVQSVKDLEAELATAKADVKSLAQEIVGEMAQVIDLDAEREKRRPEVAAAKPSA